MFIRVAGTCGPATCCVCRLRFAVIFVRTEWGIFRLGKRYTGFLLRLRIRSLFQVLRLIDNAGNRLRFRVGLRFLPLR